MQLTEEHQAFRNSIRAFVGREIEPHVESWEAAGAFPSHDVFAKLGRAGWLGIEYGEAYGGQGADHSFTVVFGEELGRIGCGGVPMAISVQTDMATPALHRYGSEELKQRFLAPAIAGDVVVSIAVTEPDAGSDVAAIRTRAVKDGDDWVIDGTKLYITNGVEADWLCLLTRTSGEGGYRGMTQIIVPTATPGVAVSRKLDKLGNRSSDTAELSFSEVRVPVANTIGEEGAGFSQQMDQFQHERLIASYMAVGGMSRALERTVAYLRERKAFGAPLIENHYVAYKLAELDAELDMLREYNYACAEKMMRGEDVLRCASIAKLTAGRLQRKVADTCMQFHGGIGYMEQTWTARYFRDSRLLSIGGGADEVMLRILSRMGTFA